LTAENSEFVALIRVLSFDEYLERDISGYEGKMPYSMTVEIIKKYKGGESRKRIKIWGDDGTMCRPYLSEFKINNYYLIAPHALNNTANTEFEFFSCRTDYLRVDISTNKAYGKYSLIKRQIDIKTFESKLKHGDSDLAIVGTLISLLILILVIVRRNKKRNANNVYN